MTLDKVIPTVIVVLSVLSSFVYFAGGDVRRGIYWACSAGLIAAVTY